jgi:O-methyltransferase
VYRGGTAMMLASLMEQWGHADRKLRLFDSFQGMPKTDEHDWHQAGDFEDTSAPAVASRIPQNFVELFPGFMPQSFSGLEEARLCFAHIDVDIYRSVLDCSAFVYPRLCAGGFLIYDDYGFVSCPGARRAVDEFFRDKPEVPLVTPGGQAIVFKL